MAKTNSFEDLTGRTFGRLTVISFSERKNGFSYWLCECNCGKRKTIANCSLQKPERNTTSCGCYQREAFQSSAVAANTKHGATESREYLSWCRMIQRCHNPKHPQFGDYGGRGITVCDKWRESFEAFYEHIGPKPSSGHSIDRFPNNNGNYEPGNVRWATTLEQNNNRRSNRFVAALGKTQTIAQWSRETGVKSATIIYRLNHGVPPEIAVTADAIKSKGVG